MAQYTYKKYNGFSRDLKANDYTILEIVFKTRSLLVFLECKNNKEVIEVIFDSDFIEYSLIDDSYIDEFIKEIEYDGSMVYVSKRSINDKYIIFASDKVLEVISLTDPKIIKGGD